MEFIYNFGNLAIPEGPLAFRPTIARGLVLSAIFGFKFLLFYYRAISMPRTIDSYKSLTLKGY
jgi:hypothetical protein